MGLCCSKPVIIKPTETPSAAVATQEPILEQNPMIPHDQHGVPSEDEITIVHVVQPVDNVIEVVVADPVEIPPAIIESEPRRDSIKPPCQIELYKEAIGVIEKHPREPTVI
jgi:hypothetical protein